MYKIQFIAIILKLYMQTLMQFVGNRSQAESPNVTSSLSGHNMNAQSL